MSLFRIVLKRTNKRKYDKSPCRDVLTVLLFVFLLPYVISWLWGHIGEESYILFGYEKEEEEWIDTEYEVRLWGEWGNKRMSMQEYLIQKLKIVMPCDDETETVYETEALKAQAVLLRTQVWELYLADKDNLEGNTVSFQDDAFFYCIDNYYMKEEEARYREAVCETDGVYLSYEGHPIKAAYFPVSNGQTRNAAEIAQNENYPYLVGTECRQDILAKEFQSHVNFSKTQYCELVKQIFQIEDAEEEVWNRLSLTYDSAGYVKEVEVNGHLCNGEVFRSAFGLHSSCFEVKWDEEGVTFYVKGVGHGLGMSQYDANQRALDGDTFDEILANYFFQAELVKIE